MKSNVRKIDLTDDLIREACKIEIDSVDVPIPLDAWQRIEADLAPPRVTSVKRSFSWSTLAAAAAVFLVLTIGGAGLFRSMQSGIPVADSGLAPAAGEEIAMLQIEDEADEADEDSIGIMAAKDDRATDEAPFMIAEAEPEVDEWPLLLADEYFLSSTVILDSEDHPAYSGAFYRGSDAELLYVKSESLEAPVTSFVDLLGLRIGSELEVIDRTAHYLYFETLNMPGLAWQDESRNQALMVVSGSLDITILEEIASGLK
jgi:hypothetical protein